ncbi:MAG: gamma-glutamyl-gamma-aminobutyrate hydrolase family protein [Phycisphaerales bacterium]
MPLAIVGITPDVAVVNHRLRVQCALAYSDAVTRAGGTPVVLVPDADRAEEQFGLCDAIVLTGGDDPRTEAYGEPTHPKATPVHARRQAFETRLLELLEASPRPVLGVCLGMQMMALHAGGRLDQHMPDTRADAGRHWDSDHEIVPTDALVDGAIGGTRGKAVRTRVALPAGTVHSRHKQAVCDAGRLAVLATSDDGVIEGVCDTRRRFHLGVQWHPERTADPALGQGLFDALIEACRRSRGRGAARATAPARTARAATAPPL